MIAEVDFTKHGIPIEFHQWLIEYYHGLSFHEIAVLRSSFRSKKQGKIPIDEQYEFIILEKYWNRKDIRTCWYNTLTHHEQLHIFV